MDVYFLHPGHHPYDIYSSPPSLPPHGTSITTPLHALYRIRPHYIPSIIFVLLARFCIIIPSPALESKLRSPHYRCTIFIQLFYPLIIGMIIHLLVNSLFHGTLRTSNLLTLIQPSLSASLNHRSAVQSPIAVNLPVHPSIHPESIFCLCLGNDVEAFVLINVNSRAYFKLQGTYS